MKLFKLLATAALTISLTGCAGLFLAGAATTATIVTDTRSTSEMWRDNNIEFEVASITSKTPYVDNVRVTSSAYKGIVVLMGQTNDETLMAELIDDVKDIEGVTEVYDQVRQREPLSVSGISRDSWITTKVKSALLTEKELNGVKVKVITEDEEVFLLGYVSHHHADIATDVARNISGVKKVVRAFQYGD
ncbi:BON domain-containing protein [Vibrio agarivorans]|uniref:BON domain-containing protein n=1 Tax=Vibrio agarivorans TaxID=153622 RepID=A0ABT7Y1U0_9VIBR|nr:BON domain-containing protein [Vibrio agarivorans]MDN2482009.1 BON domain-containing protein [Vibrio agarivorans]